MASEKDPKIPRITAAQIKKSMADFPSRFKEMEQREEDRRCLRGEFAPKVGVCHVCNGRVEAQIRFPHTDVLGGPPMSGYVHHWSCQNCGIMYEICPPKQ